MFVESPTMDAADELADMWVSLAADQRTYGSHLEAGANRGQIRSAISRHVISNRLKVARENDRLLGFVMFTVDSGSLRRSVSRGLVENLYVVPDRRREGIGTALLSAAETALQDKSVDVIALDVLAANDDARAFYRDHGYDPHRVTVERSIENDTHSKGDE